MHPRNRELLDPPRRAFVERHLGSFELVADMSWGQVDTVVLHVRAADGDAVVKFAGPGNHHIGRDVTAHESFTAPLVRHGLAGRLLAADRSLSLLVTAYLPGILSEGTPAEHDVDLHAQAGAALRLLHDQAARVDPDYEKRVTDKALAWLDRPHRIAPHIEAEARRRLSAYRPRPVMVVPTHGDWQPRNWLVDDGMLRVIDFGRFDFRPAATDLCRLAAQQWQRVPGLEAAFLEAYGSDPRDPEVWRFDMLREAVGTAAWAHQVGDADFEEQGHRMLEAALARFAGHP